MPIPFFQLPVLVLLEIQRNLEFKERVLLASTSSRSSIMMKLVAMPAVCACCLEFSQSELNTILKAWEKGIFVINTLKCQITKPLPNYEEIIKGLNAEEYNVEREGLPLPIAPRSCICSPKVYKIRRADGRRGTLFLKRGEFHLQCFR